MTSEWIKTGTAIVASCVVGAVAALALMQGRDIDVTVSPKSGLSFSTQRGQTLTELVRDGLKAVEPAAGDSDQVLADKAQARAEMAAFFATKGYYQLADPTLVTVLRGLPADDGLAVELREMLYALEGPFALPGTLRGAKSGFWDALDDLYAGLRDAPDGDSEFFATIYSKLIHQETIFSPHTHKISVDLTLIRSPHREGLAKVFICPGSALRPGSTVLLNSGQGMLKAVLFEDPMRFNSCQPRTPYQFLSGARVALGVNESAFGELFAGSEVPGAQASMIVYPRNTGPQMALAEVPQ